MLAEIITIGDELLIGQVVDTNSAWMGRNLNAIGVKVKQITSVSDEEEHILKALEEASSRADLILVTGGLGPTKDDITKLTLCKYFNTSLRFDEGVYKNVERLFAQRGRTVSEVNRKQAEVPENCTVLYNDLGTAAGMWFEEKDRIFVSMPGVPYEMMHLMEHWVLPKLKENYKLPAIEHRTILTQGIGESYLAELIENWENELPAHMKLAYLPSTGSVRLRLSAYGKDKNILAGEIDSKISLLIPLIRKYQYGFEDDSLEQVLGTLLKEKKATLSTAESCTGGYIGHRITAIPGSSSYFMGGIIAYDYAVKEHQLNIPANTLLEKGAVSEEVVIGMAENVKKILKTDYSIACSGIAGPGGGTPEKPVGTVWMAVSGPERTVAKKYQLGENRLRIIENTALYSMSLLRKMLLNELE